MRQKLPEAFENRMKELLGGEYEEYAACFDKASLGGLRVNTLKLSAEEFRDISPYPLERIPWIANGFFYPDDVQPAKHPFYYGGLYYLQEPSAMTPASLLPVQPGDRVLDICAAPGGKSTELAAKLAGKGVLVSNDISNSRAKALLKNLELFGVKNALVVSEAPSKLSGRFEGYFDKILVDAPCSGEGMFRKSPAIMKNWEQYGTSYYNDLQKQILPEAVKMLRPGGMLLYSTCTFSPEENEGTVQFLLERYPELGLLPALPEHAPQGLDYEGFATGRPEWIGSTDRNICKTIRLWPHKIRGEGHFIALFQKNGQSTGCAAPEHSSKKTVLPEEAEEFLSHLGFEVDRSRLVIREERLYLLPEGLPDVSGLRILRSGLLLGELKKNRFEPSQALACALSRREYDNCYDLPAEDEDIIRYLKCESIELKHPVKDGFVLVCAGGYPLGWGKVSKGSFKNKYLPGWRMM